MSYWFAARNPIISLKNGLNLQIPYHEERYDDIVLALKNGEITEQEIGDAIRPTIAFWQDLMLKRIIIIVMNNMILHVRSLLRVYNKQIFKRLFDYVF